MSEPVCPYCRMPFEDAGGAVPAKIFCTACGMPHHEDCYRENGGCTVFGCPRAPADDPKLQVSMSDLRAVNLPAQPYAPVAQPYAPVQTAYTPTPQYPPSIYGGPLGLSQAAAPVAAASPSVPPASTTNSVPPPAPPGGLTNQPAMAPAYTPAHSYMRSRKSRSTYIVLGIFLGALGVHNFYGGYTGRGIGQLCLSILTLGYLAIVSWVWAIIEICVVDKDSTGLNFS